MESFGGLLSVLKNLGKENEFIALNYKFKICLRNLKAPIFSFVAI